MAVTKQVIEQDNTELQNGFGKICLWVYSVPASHIAVASLSNPAEKLSCFFVVVFCMYMSVCTPKNNWWLI